MEFTVAEYVGLVAGTLTTAAYLPQVYKTWRTKAVGDISLVMYWALTIGIGLWMVYGVLIRAWAVIIANGVSLLLVGWMLKMKIRYGRAERARLQRVGRDLDLPKF